MFLDIARIVALIFFGTLAWLMFVFFTVRMMAHAWRIPSPTESITLKGVTDDDKNPNIRD